MLYLTLSVLFIDMWTAAGAGKESAEALSPAKLAK